MSVLQSCSTASQAPHVCMNCMSQAERPAVSPVRKSGQSRQRAGDRWRRRRPCCAAGWPQLGCASTGCSGLTQRARSLVRHRVAPAFTCACASKCRLDRHRAVLQTHSSLTYRLASHLAHWPRGRRCSAKSAGQSKGWGSTGCPDWSAWLRCRRRPRWPGRPQWAPGLAPRARRPESRSRVAAGPLWRRCLRRRPPHLIRCPPLRHRCHCTSPRPSAAALQAARIGFCGQAQNCYLVPLWLLARLEMVWRRSARVPASSAQRLLLPAHVRLGR